MKSDPASPSAPNQVRDASTLPRQESERMDIRYTAGDLALWSGGEWVSLQPPRVVGFSKDTRTLNKNDLYVAIQGEKYDGHDFVGDALRKRACGAIVNRAWFQASLDSESGDQSDVKLRGSPLLVVDDTRAALLDIARGYREKVDPDIIAVTGSAGKSTVKEMTAQILESSFETASTLGNWNNDIGLPMSILKMDRATERGVFELGTNHPGEIADLCSILKPDWGVVTNVGPVHIEFFDSVEAIADEKSDLLRSLPEDGVSVLNADDDYYDLVKQAATEKVITVSESKNTDYNYVIIEGTGKVLVKEVFSGEEMLFSPVVPGRHNIINALMAVAIARGQNVGWKRIKAALENYKPMSMRWEKVKMGDITMINDAYNANPLSMRASISAFEDEAVDGDKWLVLAGMSELGRMQSSEHVRLGEYVGEGNWGGVVLIGGFGDMISRGIETTGYDSDRIYMCVNNAEAAEVLEKNIDNGDAVLLKASRSMKLEEIMETVQMHLE